MADATCSVEDCPEPPKARGMCQRHYHRFWRTHLNPNRCKIDGCPNKRSGRGWCSAHYTAWRRTGDPLGQVGPTAEERWSRSFRRGPGCWIWTAAFKDDGYGIFSERGHLSLAHRYTYERLVGPIPDGHQAHHLCHVRACVNPDHLELLTASEHTRRHQSEREVTHCPQGHPYDEVNTYVHPTRGYRCCRACHREQERRRRVRTAA